MLAKKVCKSLKILFKIIGNLCSCMSSVNSSLKCQNQTLEINFFRARIVFRNKLFKKKSKIFVRSIERVGVQIVEYWWQTLASWHSYKFEGKYGRLQYEGCGGISDYNLHQNNNKMEIFSKHILNTANTTRTLRVRKYVTSQIGFIYLRCFSEILLYLIFALLCPP